MKRIAILAAVVTAAGLTTAALSTAAAAPAPAATVCKNTTLGAGTYDRVTVIGSCWTGDGTVRVLGKVTERTHAKLYVNDGSLLKVGGNLVLENGASYRNYSGSSTHVFGDVIMGTNTTLGADSQDSVFKVDGDVSAIDGAKVNLGCTPAHPCFGSVEVAAKAASVPFVQLPPLDIVDIGGSVNLSNVFNAAFNGVTIHGNLISEGGGAGPIDPQVAFIPFSIKDDIILGNVRVRELNTVWFGVIRSRIGGSVTLAKNLATDPDGNEVVANKIGGNLNCRNNVPASQFGDAIEDGPFPGYGPNRVGGTASGQCADLTALPAG